MKVSNSLAPFMSLATASNAAQTSAGNMNAVPATTEEGSNVREPAAAKSGAGSAVES